MLSRSVLRDSSAWFSTVRRMASSSVSQVQHDEKRHRFFIPMEGTRKEAVLSYALPRENVIDLQHTFVPEEFRGKGVAALLMENALKFAAEKDLKTQLTCWYAAEYVEKNKSKLEKSPTLKKIEFL